MKANRESEAAAELKRRTAIVNGLVDRALEVTPNDVEASCALMRASATVIARRVGEAMACDLMLAALIETRATLHQQAHATAH